MSTEKHQRVVEHWQDKEVCLDQKISMDAAELQENEHNDAPQSSPVTAGTAGDLLNENQMEEFHQNLQNMDEENGETKDIPERENSPTQQITPPSSDDARGSSPSPTESPVSQSLVSQSPVSQSPVSQSPVSQNPVSQSPVSQNPVSQSPVSQSLVSQSPVSQKANLLPEEITHLILNQPGQPIDDAFLESHSPSASPRQKNSDAPVEKYETEELSENPAETNDSIIPPEQLDGPVKQNPAPPGTQSGGFPEEHHGFGGQEDLGFLEKENLSLQATQNAGVPAQHNPGHLVQNPGFPVQNPGFHVQNPGFSGQNTGQCGHPVKNPGNPVQNPGNPVQNPGYIHDNGHDQQQIQLYDLLPETGHGNLHPEAGHRDSEAEADYDSNAAEQLELVFFCWIIWLFLLPLTIWFLPGSFKIIMEYQRGIVLRRGRAIRKMRTAGLTFLIPFIDQLQTCDIRTVSKDIPPQEILTSDSTSVSVDAVLYYRIFDPYLALVKAEDVHNSTSLLAQTTIRSFLGSKSLTQLLSKKEDLSRDMLAYLDDVTDKWGIKVERLELKDIRLPYHMQRAMAAEAEASREARAKVIQAEGEHLASIKLKEAADIINQSEGAIQLRFLQTMTHVSNLRNHTVVMPLDADVMKGVTRKMKRMMKKRE